MNNVPKCVAKYVTDLGRVYVGNYGFIVFDDCMKVMSKFEDKKFQFVFTDPPYNVVIGSEKRKKKYRGKDLAFADQREFYEDAMTPEDYLAWCQEWYAECRRIADIVVIYPGGCNETMWVKYIDEPKGRAYHIKNNANISCSTSHFDRVTPVLIFADKFPRKNKLPVNYYSESIPINLPMNYYYYHSKWGFVRNPTGNGHEYNHPCPIRHAFWKHLISDFKPVSVFDPFMGTGSTGQVCEELGIYYAGAEKDVTYLDDIKHKVQSGISKYKPPKQVASIAGWQPR